MNGFQQSTLAGEFIQITKGTTVKAVTIRSRTPTKIICILPTKKAAVGVWNVQITNTDHTTVTKTGAFTIKKRTSAEETKTEPVSSIILPAPVPMPSSVVPSRGSSLSGRVLVTVNGSILPRG